MEVIKSSDGCTIAIVIRKSFNKDGVNFVSENSFPLQLGINSYVKGHEIKAHFHKKQKITLSNLQEAIFIKSGKVLVNLFDQKKEAIKTLTLSTGDLTFFVNGGYQLEMLEDTAYFMVKQGPRAVEENNPTSTKKPAKKETQ